MREYGQVRDFHRKHGFPENQDLVPQEGVVSAANDALYGMAAALRTLASEDMDVSLTYQEKGDERLYRMALLIEEVGELAGALKRGSTTELADALGDLMYVVVGTAVTYGIPIREVFEEIHRSNMTKKPRDPENDPRMRQKGRDYEPPRLMVAIEAGRAALRREGLLS